MLSPIDNSDFDSQWIDMLFWSTSILKGNCFDMRTVITKFNRSAKVAAVVYLLVFLFMLLCNTLTLKIADDWDYCFSWADGSRIVSVLQIGPSMMAHAFSMNGRLIAHAIAQFFLMLPEQVFDVVNSVMFVVLLTLIAHICCGKEHNNLLIVGILCAIWRYTLSFGQVYLWLIGSCNYWWNVGFCLLFIQPYIAYFNNGEQGVGLLQDILFLMLSFVAGGYGETSSAAFIFIAATCLMQGFVHQKRLPIKLILGLVMAVVGYLSIYMAPAQMHKGGGLDLPSVYNGIVRCLEKLYSMRALVIVFAVLFVLCLLKKVAKKRVQLAGIFFMGAMCSNFILAFAGSYPERTALGMTVLLIVADAILLNEIGRNTDFHMVAVGVLVILLVLTPRRFILGMEDIYQTYCGMKANEEYLIQCSENDTMDVKLPIIYADLQYSAAYGVRYLSADDPDTWPNKHMAQYYGVESILGIE